MAAFILLLEATVRSNALLPGVTLPAPLTLSLSCGILTPQGSYSVLSRTSHERNRLILGTMGEKEVDRQD